MRTALPKRIRGGKMKALEPPKDSRMANEKAAIDLQRKQPSWRATKAVNRILPTWRRPGVDLLSLGINHCADRIDLPDRLAAARPVSANSPFLAAAADPRGLQSGGLSPRVFPENAAWGV
jgi:hypothetical protein